MPRVNTVLYYAISGSQKKKEEIKKRNETGEKNQYINCIVLYTTHVS